MNMGLAPPIHPAIFWHTHRLGNLVGFLSVRFGCSICSHIRMFDAACSVSVRWTLHASNTFILTAGQMGCPRTWEGKMIRMAMVVALLFAASGGVHAQDIFGDPHYGMARLESGFTPDPHEVNVAVGGSVSASRLGHGCAGFISDRPDFRLRFDTSGWLPLYIWVESNTDTTLVINDPDGDWSCDDDSARGVNPYVKFASPSSGTYDIWIGAFSEENNFENAILRISELNIQ